MTDELIDRINEWWEYDTGHLFGYAKARILADAKVIKAAEELAKQFEIALDELQACSVELVREDYNCPDHNDALAAYRDAVSDR